MNNNLVEIALGIYKTFGRSAAKRALTPPRAWVEKACVGTGANVAEAIEERDEWVEELLEFLESLVDTDFVDPD